ncbi:MAG: C1 family peptidase [Chthoniobacterales bacterium]
MPRTTKRNSPASSPVHPRRTNARFGWLPDFPDQRDFLYAAPPVFLRQMPPKVDLRAQCPPVYDQGQLGSCTANAIGGAIEFDQMKEKLPQVFVPSRLFIYYNERVLEGSVNSDSGAMLRDGIKTVAKQGACPEPLWPYQIEKFRAKPPQSCYTEAAKHTAVSYQRLVQTLPQMKGCLASGYPFVFGFTVYESFETEAVARTGRVPMPASSEKVLGGHAVAAVGYDDAKRSFICRNSWGTGWGTKGYFTMPYAYLTDTDLAADFWTIRVVA